MQFNYGIALFCAGYLSEAEQAFRAAKKGGRDTFYEIQADSILHPQFFGRRRAIRSSSRRSTDPLLVAGRRCSSGRATSTPPSGSTHGRAAASQRRRGAGRGRGRALRRGQPLGVVLAARAARPPVPAQPVGALPPRAAARLDGAARAGDDGVPARTRARAENRARQGSKRVPRRSCDSGTNTHAKMSQTAHGVRPAPLRQLPHPQRTRERWPVSNDGSRSTRTSARGEDDDEPSTPCRRRRGVDAARRRQPTPRADFYARSRRPRRSRSRSTPSSRPTRCSSS